MLSLKLIIIAYPFNVADFVCHGVQQDVQPTSWCCVVQCMARDWAVIAVSFTATLTYLAATADGSQHWTAVGAGTQQ
jgi:hypothetical protein